MKKIIRLTENKLKEIINDKLAQASGGEPRSYPSGEQWTMGENNKSLRSVGKFPNVRKKNITKEEDNFERKETHGYERGELNKSGYDDSNNENAMGFWGLETGSGESSFSGDESAPFDSSSEIFDIKESLKKNLRKYI